MKYFIPLNTFIIITCLISLFREGYSIYPIFIIVLEIIAIMAILISNYLSKKENIKCKHRDKTLTFTYPPDNYNVYKCNDCGEADIYEAIYSE